MKFNSLGKTDLQISSLGLGTMTFGDGADETESRDIYTLARDKGINLFDCANVYAQGGAERILGHLVKPHRSEVVLTSKAYYPMSDDPKDSGLGRRHLTQSLDASLKRLQTDYLDIFFLHSFDTKTPLEETIMALESFIRAGKIIYAGVSNFAAWQVVKALQISERLKAAPIHCVQPMYNLLKRQAETELFPMAMHENLGVLTYSPLAGGLLAGKYQKAQPKQGRFNESEMYRNRYRGANIEETTAEFLKFAARHKLDPVALAIAWTSLHPAITAPLIGARTVDQLKNALSSIDVELTPNMRAELEHIAPAPSLATDREEERISLQ